MFAFLLALVTALAIPPKPATYVTDNAHVLDAARAAALNEKLAQFERDTSNQVLVYVDRKLPPGSTIEQMGSEAMHQWGVGQKGSSGSSGSSGSGFEGGGGDAGGGGASDSW